MTADHHPRRRALRLALVLLCASWLPACNSLPSEPGALDLGYAERNAPPTVVAEQLRAIRDELDADAPWHATERALKLRQARTLSVTDANLLESLLEEGVQRAATNARDADDFESLDVGDMPRRSRAMYSIAHARALIAQGEYFPAYLEIRDLERVHRTHHLRTQAGEAVFEAGSQLASDDRKLLWIFSRSTNAPQILEYMVLQHPSHPRTPEAYLRLASEYERRGERQQAIERYEELLLYHPGSPGTVEAEARVPQLRLDRQLRDDYDRGDLLLARDGLERWIERHAGREGVSPQLVAEVREDLRDSFRRLAESDLQKARFYARVDEPTGRRLHAERARGMAAEGQWDDLVAEAEELIEGSEPLLAPMFEGTPAGPLIGPMPAPSTGDASPETPAPGAGS